ncbi:DUF448 domain-containing protein [Sphingomonas oryzagri]|uniref:DUF448 domain-containing protein n=1 Tax=Sphingomonas oryzagri TaxID=3042314 RepID=A0ABT6N6C1_9SPHN|nr:DUF448 domain-containing protein [Sphingomonas oryzagri]MDH7640646.1 DUF448 domain-containing protein [Sphingomonas oryzagri]
MENDEHLNGPQADAPLGARTSTSLSANGDGGVAPSSSVRPELVEGRAKGDAHTPERKCILSGAHDAKDNLIRLAISPDGLVLPDIRAKAPGRGAWLGVDRETLDAAQKKGKLKGALARAFKGKPLTIPDDLGQMIETALERAFLDRLGLESRAGTVSVGSDRIGEAARKGRVHLLLHAADAGEDGNRKLDQALRVGSDAEGTDLRGLVLPLPRTILSMALGRENVVHVALTDRAAALRVEHDLSRWRGFIGRKSGAEPRDSSRGLSALTGLKNADGPAAGDDV